MARLPPADGANGEPPSPPTAVSKRVTPRSIAVHALSRAVRPGVVEVQPDVGADGVEHGADAAGRRHAGGVGERDLVDAGGAGVVDERRDVVGRDVLAGERRAEGERDHLESSTAAGAAARIASTWASASSTDMCTFFALYAARGRHGDREVVDAGRGGQLGALDVGHERPRRLPRRRRSGRIAGDDLGRPGHRRHRLRRHERRHLDVAPARRRTAGATSSTRSADVDRPLRPAARPAP